MHLWTTTTSNGSLPGWTMCSESYVASAQVFCDFTLCLWVSGACISVGKLSSWTACRWRWRYHDPLKCQDQLTVTQCHTPEEWDIQHWKNVPHHFPNQQHVKTKCRWTQNVCMQAQGLLTCILFAARNVLFNMITGLSQNLEMWKVMAILPFKLSTQTECQNICFDFRCYMKY